MLQRGPGGIAATSLHKGCGEGGTVGGVEVCFFGVSDEVRSYRSQLGMASVGVFGVESAVGDLGVGGGLGGGREFGALTPGLPDCFDGVAGVCVDFLDEEEIVDCKGRRHLFVPVVYVPGVDGPSACWSRRGVVKVCGCFALSLVRFAICLWGLDVEAMAGVSGSAVALGASGACRLCYGELAGVEEESVGVGDIKESFFFLESPFLLVDEVDGSFADALFHGSVLFDCDCDGEIVLFLESVDFGLEAILFKNCISSCSIMYREEGIMFSWWESMS